MSKKQDDDQVDLDNLPYQEWIETFMKKTKEQDLTAYDLDIYHKYTNNLNDRYYSFRGHEARRDMFAPKFHQIWQHHKSWLKPFTRSTIKRRMHIDSPGQEARRNRVGAVRRSNRSQVSFYCRYVIAKKNLKIPLKF